MLKQLLRKSNVRLYPDHIPTSVFQKALLAAGSSLMSLRDPYRDDMIAVCGEVLGHQALELVYNKMAADPEGSQILQDKPLINTTTVDMNFLKTLPENTFGRKYHDFMAENRISADTRKPVKFVDDPELAYVMRRYREGHDFNHLILQMPPNYFGEVIIKWFEAIQTQLPMCWLGAIFGATQLNPKQKKIYLQHYLPWVIDCAQKSSLIMNVYFEKRWEQDLEDLKRELNVIPFQSQP